jgi:hypothetical protein
VDPGDLVLCQTVDSIQGLRFFSTKFFNLFYVIRFFLVLFNVCSIKKIKKYEIQIFKKFNIVSNHIILAFYHSRRPCEGVRLAASSLAIAKNGARKSLDSQLKKSLHARVMQAV